MLEFLSGVGTALLTIVFVLASLDWHKRYRKQKARKRYEQLAHGTPKVVKTILTEVELWEHSNKPIMIDGEVYKREYYDGSQWHCNQEIVPLVNTLTGDEVRLHLTENYLSSVVSVKVGDYPNVRYKRCSRFAVVMEVYKVKVR